MPRISDMDSSKWLWGLRTEMYRVQGTDITTQRLHNKCHHLAADISEYIQSSSQAKIWDHCTVFSPMYHLPSVSHVQGL
jgi:hypothetical protein